MHGSVTEHWQLRWDDLNLCYDGLLKQWYIDFNERQTQTRAERMCALPAKRNLECQPDLIAKGVQ